MVPYFTYLPYTYFLKTRLVGSFQRISWVFVYFIPLIFLYSRLVVLKNVYDYALLILGVIIVNYVYENGYLENDIKTIKKESKPTLRLSPEEIKSIDSKFGPIFIMRTVILLLLLAAYLVSARSASENINPWVLLYVIIFLQILYLIYNRIRNIANLFLIIPLSFVRFYGFMIPFIACTEMGWFIILATLLYPLSKCIEFSQKYSFGDRKISFNLDKFRVLYYLILSIILGAGLLVFSARPFLIIFFELAIYFLIYRLMGLLIISNKKVLGGLKNNLGRSGTKNNN